MTQIVIGVGATANDGTGDQLRTAFQSTNTNVAEIYAGGATVVNATVPALPYGITTDLEGMIARDDLYLYVCFQNYVNDTTACWKRLTLDVNTSEVLW